MKTRPVTIVALGITLGALTSLCPPSHASDGGRPVGSVVIDSSGDLFGVTYAGGTYNLGTLYELTYSDGTYTYSVLHNFEGTNTSPADGANPTDLCLGTDGTIYGVTEYGGSGTPTNGTVFAYNSTGGYAKLMGMSDKDPATYEAHNPTAIVDHSGTLYVTCSRGGYVPSDAPGQYLTYYGAVVPCPQNGTTPYTSTQITTALGDSTEISCDDLYAQYGANPVGNVAFISSTAYLATPGGGTTSYNGQTAFNGYFAGYGNLGHFSPSGGSGGNWASSYAFQNNTGTSGSPGDGSSPLGRIASAGSTIYGISSNGGLYGDGSYWEYNTSSGFSVLAAIGNTSAGTIAPSAPVQYGGVTYSSSTSELYIASPYGGTDSTGHQDFGQIFTASTSSPGTLTTIYTFAGFPSYDGSVPNAVSVDSSGNIFGSTQSGGSYNAGVIYELAYSSGTYTYSILHDFGPNVALDSTQAETIAPCDQPYVGVNSMPMPVTLTAKNPTFSYSTGESLTLSWTSVSGATSYSVYKSSSDWWTDTSATATTTSTSWTDTSAGTSAQYQVVATLSSGAKEASNVLSDSITVFPPYYTSCSMQTSTKQPNLLLSTSTPNEIAVLHLTAQINDDMWSGSSPYMTATPEYLLNCSSGAWPTTPGSSPTSGQFFAGPSGGGLSWVPLTATYDAANISTTGTGAGSHDEIWYAVVPTPVSNVPITVSYWDPSNFIANYGPKPIIEMDTFSGVDPNLPSSTPGIDGAPSSYMTEPDPAYQIFSVSYGYTFDMTANTANLPSYSNDWLLAYGGSSHYPTTSLSAVSGYNKINSLVNTDPAFEDALTSCGELSYTGGTTAGSTATVTMQLGGYDVNYLYGYVTGLGLKSAQ